MTYSMVARDPENGDLGVAVQSHFFGVGRVVGWARPGVGALATQAFADMGYGPRGLDAMRSGASAQEAIDQLTAKDDLAAARQLGFVDAEGNAAAHTGDECLTHAGHVTGAGVTAQGNMLERDSVWPAMLAAYEATDGPLEQRLLAALDAAEAEGGDIRGKQSASIFVVSDQPRDEWWSAIRVDCRVDDSPAPLPELRRLVTLNGFYGRMLELFSEEGILGGPLSPDQAALDRALADLAAGREVLGENMEATFWEGVVLARVGRDAEARERFEAAFAVRPLLAEFLSRMAPGVFPDDPDGTLARVATPLKESTPS